MPLLNESFADLTRFVNLSFSKGVSFIRRRIASCADDSDVQHKTKALTVSGMHKEHMSESDRRTVRYWMTRKRPTRAGSNLCGLDAGFPELGSGTF